MNRIIAAFILAGLMLGAGGAMAQFDQSHAAFTAILKKHVVLIEGGKTSQVRYGELLKERSQLKAYLDSLTRVTESEFKGWTKPQQLAFLINAYNGWTLELILTRYPDLKSIRDFGYLPFNNIWKKKWFTFLGREYFLDGIEHEMIRAPGVYDDPRIHFAVNCASIGCPMLREEAYVAERIDQQLDEQTTRFLSDRSRNRVNKDGVIEASKIFDWYKGDFNKNLKGIKSSEEFFGRYAAQLTDNAEHQKLVREGKASIKYLDYDWTLNQAR
ncbi:MAG: DUF547 domain-containing protein [Burkholderiales bacterium]